MRRCTCSSSCAQVGCSRVLVSLSTRHRFLFGPYVEALEKPVFKAIYDRNITVSSSYTTAAGYLARVGPRAFLAHLINVSKVAFFDREGELCPLLSTFPMLIVELAGDRAREISGEIVLAISK